MLPDYRFYLVALSGSSCSFSSGDHPDLNPLIQACSLYESPDLPHQNGQNNALEYSKLSE